MSLQRYLPPAGIVVVVIATVLVKLFCLEFFVVAGTSMEPAIGNGTIAIINKCAYGIHNPLTGTYVRQPAEPQCGDIVVFPVEGISVVKRCVANAGTPLSVKVTDNDVYSLKIGVTDFPVTRAQSERFLNVTAVPDYTFFAVGDNLETSIDSREYGFVSVNSVQGKIILAAGKKIHEQ